MGKPEPIRNVFDAMKGRRLGKSVTAMFAVPFWPAIVGSRIAIHCKPTEFRNGELMVECDSSSWSATLAENQTLILSKIEETVGHRIIKSIRPVVKRQKIEKIASSDYREPDVAIPPAKFAWIETVAGQAPKEVRESLMKAMISTIENKIRQSHRRTK